MQRMREGEGGPLVVGEEGCQVSGDSFFCFIPGAMAEVLTGNHRLCEQKRWL